MKKAKEIVKYLRKLKREKMFTDLGGKVHRRVCISEDAAENIIYLLDERIPKPRQKLPEEKED